MDASFFLFLLLIGIGIALYAIGKKRVAQQIEAFTNDVERQISSDELGGYVATHYDNVYINKEVQKGISKELSGLYESAETLRKKMALMSIKNECIDKLLYQYEHLPNIVQKHNQQYLEKQLTENKVFFDTVLKYPLDAQQRRAIVSEEQNCLVVSSAGSGKTSCIVGKVKYLTQIRHIAPERILLISYTNKAASELTDRMGIDGMRGFTFHKLAIDLIATVQKEKPTVCENTDRLFIDIFRELTKDRNFRESVCDYFIDYQMPVSNWEKQKAERQQQLREEKQNQYKALFPDMDGLPIYVKSEQELKLCSVLASLGVAFRYEEAYEHPLANEQHSQYKPDFSIHYKKDGADKRIYLENFGIDEHGLVPTWFAEYKGISYEEANQRYTDGITWKREIHKNFGTTLIETTSADFHYFDMKEKVAALLKENGVPFSEIPDDELYNIVLPKGSKQEKAFIRLMVTFITLLKTNCKSIQEVLREAEKNNDERSTFIISHIIAPVYEMYVEKLHSIGQKDFTDIIIEATELCCRNRPWQYDYIIVDEFQDISVDRYKFLQALRSGPSPARLFCVGDDWQSIYRFSGSDMALFSRFAEFFGETEINKIETTFRFGNPVVKQSSAFIQRNPIQVKKNIHPFNQSARTKLVFQAYTREHYAGTVEYLVRGIPADKSIFLLGRYSFDDYYLSYAFKSAKQGNKFFYTIGGRDIEFLTVHKSKGLEADYVILLQCNKDTFGFPSTISDDPILNLVLSKGDEFPFGEERRLFYVAITRAKEKTIVLYDHRFPSVFVNEFLHPERDFFDYNPHKNANKYWGKKGDAYLRQLYREGNSIKVISQKMGRSQTAIVMRLQKLGLVEKSH